MNVKISITLAFQQNGIKTRYKYKLEVLSFSSMKMRIVLINYLMHAIITPILSGLHFVYFLPTFLKFIYVNTVTFGLMYGQYSRAISNQKWVIVARVLDKNIHSVEVWIVLHCAPLCSTSVVILQDTQFTVTKEAFVLVLIVTLVMKLLILQ